MLRVLHYVDENNLTWSESWVQLLNKIGKSNVENVVVCRDGGTLISKLRNVGIECFTYKPRLSSLPCTAFGFDLKIKEIRPDIIHTRLSSAASIGGYWGNKENIPVAATLDKYAKYKYYKNVSVLLACSAGVMQDMINQGFPNNRIRVLHNAIDISRYKRDIEIGTMKRQELSLKSGELLFISAGRFDAGKGMGVLINAFAVLTNKLRVNAKLLLLGDGPDRNNCIGIAERLGLDGKVLFPGFVSDVRSWFWASDIYVFPSDKPDAFGISLLEAMASGLPPIATNVGGPLEMIQDGINGVITEPGNCDALAEAMAKMAANADFRKRIAGNAIISSERFDIENVAEETVNFYNEILNDANR